MNKELYHHGILGQKWGVRRFQNKDGTLTQKGKNRYSDNNDHSASEKKAGLKKSIDETKKNESLNRLKQTLTMGAVSIGSVLLTCGAYKIKDLKTSGKLDEYVDMGKSMVNEYIGGLKKDLSKAAHDRREVMIERIEDGLDNLEAYVNAHPKLKAVLNPVV